ncbi:renal dipeptidase family [Massariosphaeria phaeospora]|uniref:Dipeptidase n=1 Tax=Massariosphaeria phaeospora TaxID=100035 RepID=A0A7C8I584_9PLEO|nr:renal dipeptidase family [Massariosphaeria phaeospora]
MSDWGVDGHNDWPHLIRGYYDNNLDARFVSQNDLAGHVDIKRLKEGKMGGVFWSAYVDCPEEGDFSDANHLEPLRDTLQQIDLIHRLINIYKDDLELVDTAADVMRIFRDGRCASLIGVEGLHQIGNSASVLRMYHRLGVRYITLAHNKNNLYADSATAVAPAHDGLSSKGKEMVLEMNRIGMMIDLSHCSEAVVSDVLQQSKAPVIFTHSSCHTLIATPRNVSDAALDNLRANNGVIMISLIPALTASDPNTASLNDVVDHIVYVGDRIGYSHIGIGSDFDGMVKAVRGVEDISKMPSIIARMLERGISETNVKLVMGLNIIRVLQDVEDAARILEAQIPVLEDAVKHLWNADFRKFVESEYPDAQKHGVKVGE